MFLIEHLKAVAAAVLALSLAGCGPDYSPNTYSTAAVQQANKVDKGIVIGVRQIDVSSSGVIGAGAGAAAGGLMGSNTPGGLGSAIGTIGGGLVGGIIGSSVEHVTVDTSAFEYIVRKPNGDLISVTQKDAVALALGQHVLVIAGNQARIVPDYTVVPDTAPTPPPPPVASAAPAATATEPPPTPVSAIPLPSATPSAPTPSAPTPLLPSAAAPNAAVPSAAVP
jgi:outer membrane lipoprotein SlyB